MLKKIIILFILYIPFFPVLVASDQKVETIVESLLDTDEGQAVRVPWRSSDEWVNISNEIFKSDGSITEETGEETAAEAFDLINSEFDTILNKTGVSGGQTIIGGTDASDDLNLSSTSNATKGQIAIGGTLLTVDEALSVVTIPTLEATDIEADNFVATDGASILGGLDVTGDANINNSNFFVIASVGNIAISAITETSGDASFIADSSNAGEAAFSMFHADFLKWKSTVYNSGETWAIKDASGDVAISALSSTNHVGINTAAQKSSLEVNGSMGLKTSVISSTFHIITTDESILLGDTSSNSVTIFLNDASTVPGRIYLLKNIGTSANNLTVDAHDTQTIDGSLTQTLTDLEKIKIVAKNSNWHIIGR